MTNSQPFAEQKMTYSHIFWMNAQICPGNTMTFGQLNPLDKPLLLDYNNPKGIGNRKIVMFS